MQGFSEAGAANFYPTEVARDISDAYSRMGMGQALLENKQEEEERRRKEEKRKKVITGIILGAAALATGGAALAAAPAAAGVAGGAAAAGGAAGAGAAGAAGTAAAAGAGTAAATGAGAAGAGAAGAGAAGAGAAGGGFMSSLATFGKGALSAFTGGPSAATGAKGVIGGLNTFGQTLGSMGTQMLMSGSGGGGGGAGGGGGGSRSASADVGDAAMGALGSYLQQSQAANRSNRIMENTLKDPAIRSAMYPGVDQQQADAVLSFSKTLGAVDGSAFLQTALPRLAQYGAGNVDFDRQMRLQGSRIAQQGDVELNKVGAAAMLDAYGKTPLIPTTSSTTGSFFAPITLGIGTGAQGTGLR